MEIPIVIVASLKIFVLSDKVTSALDKILFISEHLSFSLRKKNLNTLAKYLEFILNPSISVCKAIYFNT